MKKIFQFAMFGLCLLLVSCEKETTLPSQSNLSESAQTVDEMIWGKTINSGIHESIQIGETIRYEDYNPSSEVHDLLEFKVVDRSNHTSSGLGVQIGSGITYSDGGQKKVTAAMLDKEPNTVEIRVYDGEEMVGVLFYHH